VRSQAHDGETGPSVDGPAIQAPDPSPATLDRVVHDRIRLGILAALALNPSLTFTDLKRLLGATDGNLTVHARRLEAAGYVTCTKTTDRRLVRTTFALAPAGRAALRKYLAEMKQLAERLG
jgi:DNA-binding MarR family transcriptional regulator